MSPCSTAVFQRGQLRTRAWIEPVAAGIPEKIKGEYSAHDRQRRENDQVRSVKQMAAGNPIARPFRPYQGQRKSQQKANRARRPDSRFALRVKAALGRGWGRLLPLMPVTQSREQKNGRHAGQSASDKENAVGVNEAVRAAQPFDRSAGKSL
jgi:hypothetical protein